MAALDFIFEPRKVAVIGVDADPHSLGFVALKNALFGCLYATEPDGFLGELYAVGQGGNVLGVPVLPNIQSLPEEIDLAIVASPGEQAAKDLEALADKGVAAAIVLADASVQALHEVARDKGIRLLGPSSHGVVANTRHLNASLCPLRPYVGRIALVADHGSILNAYLQHSHDENVGFSVYLSCGQEGDISIAEVLHALAQHPMTNVVALAFGQPKDRAALVQAVRTVVAKKPVVYLRSGRSYGADLDAELEAAGAFGTKSLAEFVDAARALSIMAPAKTPKIEIVTNGGPWALAQDTAREMGLEVVKVHDLGAMADPSAFKAALEEADARDGSAGLCVILSLQPGSLPLPIAEVVADWADQAKKPITASCVGLAGQPCEDHLDFRGVPEYEFPERALLGLKALVHRGKLLA